MLMSYDPENIKKQRDMSSLFSPYNVQANEHHSKKSIKFSFGSQMQSMKRTSNAVAIDIPYDVLTQLNCADEEIWKSLPILVKQQIFLELGQPVLRRHCWVFMRKVRKLPID